MADINEKLRFLSHFLGPKGENGMLLAGLVDEIVSEYVSWRRNYQTGDKSLGIQSEFSADRKKIKKEMDELLSRLKGSFPIYSPRYIGHQLSDTLITSVMGALAGALYNANNVTPEAGIVSVDLEIEACNALATMLGYRSPPDPPKFASDDEKYEEKLKADFSWCHLTSGGTVANIEALWVARTIKYFPLAVWDVCSQKEKKIPLDVELADGTIKKIGDCKQWEMLGLRPSTSIALLSAFVRALMIENDLDDSTASAAAWRELNTSLYSPAKQPWLAYADFPPCIMVSGAAHYSVTKAVDLLGIGRGAIRPIKMCDNFRMDMDDFRKQVRKAADRRECIIAVIAVAGTTEEGAVDPLHEILDVRRELEQSCGQSFWVHVDAAWGGFFKTLFVGENGGRGELVHCLVQLADRLQQPPYGLKLETDPTDDPRGWVEELIRIIRRRNRLAHPKATKDIVAGWFDQAASNGSHDCVARGLAEYVSRLSPDLAAGLAITEAGRLAVVRDFTSEVLTAHLDPSVRQFPVSWPADDDVGRAFLAFDRADSITVDPHKMGYQVYPSGAVAFRNDRIRHFIQQEAAYVTMTKTEGLVHHPMRRATPRTEVMEERKVATQAFAPFTLEGSRPAGPACALWLASKTLPFNRENHGLVVRSSLLAARYFYELIDNWEWITSQKHVSTSYKLVHYARNPPDTNIVVFGVKPKTSQEISDFNNCTHKVYQQFSIQKEIGEEESIYTQPFFLSKTEFKKGPYPYETLEHFLKREGHFRNAKADYEAHGLIVLRATVMSPHIIPALEILKHDFAMAFMSELHKVAQGICRTG